MLTVKDLKHLLEDYPDEMPIKLVLSLGNSVSIGYLQHVEVQAEEQVSLFGTKRKVKVTTVIIQ